MSEHELRIAAENSYKDVLPAIGKAFDKLEVSCIFFVYLTIVKFLQEMVLSLVLNWRLVKAAASHKHLMPQPTNYSWHAAKPASINKCHCQNFVVALEHFIN